MHWTRLGRYDEREDETIVDAGTYWTVTPDWPIEEHSERTTVVVAEVDVLEDCPAAALRYRVRRLQRYDGLTLPEDDREAYESVPDWLEHAEVYETPQEARTAAWERHREAVARSIEESAGRAAERLLQVIRLYRQGQRQGAA